MLNYEPKTADEIKNCQASKYIQRLNSHDTK